MTIAEYIINKFGGIRPMARKVSLTPSVIQSWKTSGNIPSKHQKSIYERAQELDISLSCEDFLGVNKANSPT